MKIRCLVLIIFLILSTAFAAYSNAEDVSVVRGLIESVSGGSIKVNGSYYNISGAQLLNPTGQEVSTSELTEGKKVEIYFRNNNITSVIIHDYMLE